MSFINTSVANMGEKERSRLGQTGIKINKPGAHLLTIVEAYEIGEQDNMPRFVLVAEDAEGKTVDATLFLQNKVSKKDGVVQAGEYFVNGVKTYLDQEGATYDNIKAIGQIKNLWVACGLNPDEFGKGVVSDTKQFPKAGPKPIEKWTELIGKQFTGVTSYYITLDAKGDRAWRNQKLNTNAFFTKEGFSIAEVKNNATETVALNEAVKYAIDNPEIEYKNKNNKVCLQELKLVKGDNKVPTPTEQDDFGTTEADEDDPFE